MIGLSVITAEKIPVQISSTSSIRLTFVPAISSVNGSNGCQLTQCKALNNFVTPLRGYSWKLSPIRLPVDAVRKKQIVYNDVKYLRVFNNKNKTGSVGALTSSGFHCVLDLEAPARSCLHICVHSFLVQRNTKRVRYSFVLFVNIQ